MMKKYILSFSIPAIIFLCIIALIILKNNDNDIKILDINKLQKKAIELSEKLEIQKLFTNDLNFANNELNAWTNRGTKQSKFWNDFFYFIASFMDNFEPIRWRYSHCHHHTYTIFNDPVDFEIHVKKPTDLIVFFSHYIPFSGFVFFKNSLQWETIKHAFGVTTEVMKVCIPENERSKCRWSARSHVFIWVVTIFCSIYFQSWLPVLFIVLPNFYGKTLVMLMGLTQHAGLQEDIKDHRLTTRTVI